MEETQEFVAFSGDTDVRILGRFRDIKNPKRLIRGAFSLNS